MKKLFLFLSFLVYTGSVLAQSATQVVRGTLSDVDSKTPVPGASIILLNSDQMIGTTSDADGRFRLTGVPVGRVSLRITFIGYEEMLVKDVTVNAGKEAVLDEVYGTNNPAAGSNHYLPPLPGCFGNQLRNGHAQRPAVQPGETQKYACSLGGPSRMMANIAGVSGANDARNDIIVRGNSPASLLWWLEGVNIPNPNHFGALGSSEGPVSMVNANLLGQI